MHSFSYDPITGKAVIQLTKEEYDRIFGQTSVLADVISRVLSLKSKRK